MWLIGLGALFAAASIVTWLVSLSKSSGSERLAWEVSQVAQRYIYIVGSLSGFSVASAIFVAGFIERTGSRSLPDRELCPRVRTEARCAKLACKAERRRASYSCSNRDCRSRSVVAVGQRLGVS